MIDRAVVDVDEPLLDVPRLAVALNVPASWVYAKVESGELPHFKIGKYVRFRRDAVERFLAQCQRGGARK